MIFETLTNEEQKRCLLMLDKSAYDEIELFGGVKKQIDIALFEHSDSLWWLERRGLLIHSEDDFSIIFFNIEKWLAIRSESI